MWTFIGAACFALDGREGGWISFCPFHHHRQRTHLSLNRPQGGWQRKKTPGVSSSATKSAMNRTHICVERDGGWMNGGFVRVSIYTIRS